MNSTAKLYALPYSDIKTYLLALLFVAGNVILPQTCHLFALGGKIWLPIYFFTFVGAYKYGWKVGLLTAIASPLVNAAFFDMPAAALLPAIILKSTILALAAGWMAHRTRRVTLLSLLLVVLAYQVLGTLGEWAITGSLFVALQDFRLGLPGMLVQVVGGYLIINK